MITIEIIPNPASTSDEKGKFFEGLLRKVFESQRFDITQNVRFTGMEIDLYAKHKDREETAYIECKARKKGNLSANDIHTFESKVRFKKFDYGYFVSTDEFSRDVAGVIKDYESDQDGRYKNLIFLRPDKLYSILQETGEIIPTRLGSGDFSITKRILSYTFFGTYEIYILSRGTLPTHIALFDSQSGFQISDNDIYNRLQDHIEEIKGLALLLPTTQGKTREVESIFSSKPEVVAQIQVSENWYDYLPTSSKHFVGRQQLRQRLFDFLNDIRNERTDRRVFYIDGKSGWGKSSLIADLKERCRNKYHKNRLFVSAIDTRSASSDNFILAAFEDLLVRSREFHGYDTSKIRISSKFDILGSESVGAFLKYLEQEEKFLILIFDQFEDVFKKENLYIAFHQLMLQVRDISSHIILGFSWKTELSVPIDFPAYSYWQQAREYAKYFSVDSFKQGEIRGVVRQLERGIGHSLLPELKRRIEESSQGFPWLTKKLCGHVFQQMQRGVTQEVLIEQNLNCLELFRADEEGLSPEEIRGLRTIAVRANSGDFFDKTEIDELIPEDVISALSLNKRLIVLSGTKYNIYWDVYRDYLLTGEIRTVGESYILRQTADACFDIYMLFEHGRGFSIDELVSRHPRRAGIKSTDNTLRDLRSIGLIQKDKDLFKTLSGVEISKKGFESYIAEKLKKHALYLKLSELPSETFEIDTVIESLQSVFPGFPFSKKTWEVYGRLFMNWLSTARLDIANRYIPDTRGGPRGSREKRENTFMPQNSLKSLWEVFNLIETGGIEDIPQGRLEKSNYDLKFMGLVKFADGKIVLTDKGVSIKQLKNGEGSQIEFAKCMLKSGYVLRALDLRRNSKIKKREFSKLLGEQLTHIKSKVYQRASARNVASWSDFIYNTLSADEIDLLLSSE